MGTTTIEMEFSTDDLRIEMQLLEPACRTVHSQILPLSEEVKVSVHYLAEACSLAARLEELSIKGAFYRSDEAEETVSIAYGALTEEVGNLRVGIRRARGGRTAIDLVMMFSNGRTALVAYGTTPNAIVESFGVSLREQLAKI